MNINDVLKIQIEQEQKASVELAERQKKDADALHEKYLNSPSVDIPKVTKEVPNTEKAPSVELQETAIPQTSDNSQKPEPPSEKDKEEAKKTMPEDKIKVNDRVVDDKKKKVKVPKITWGDRIGRKNLIYKYMVYQNTQYDGYHEWNLAGALQILSIMSDRKLSLTIKQDTIYPNLNIMCIGDSTVSRKSTAMKKTEQMLYALGLNSMKLPNSSSPERFIEDMTNRPHSYAFKDEAAGFIASFQKSYMAEMRDLLMELYACGDYHRALRTGKADKQTEFKITNPYLNMWLMTVPDNFVKYVTTLDVTSGWMLRYLFLCPSGAKPWMGFSEKTTEDKQKYWELINEFSTRKQMIESCTSIDAKLTKEAWEYYHNWQKNIDEAIMVESGTSLKSALYGRLQVYALKIAMLFTLGKDDLIIIPAADRNSFMQIELSEVEMACDLIDSVFYPYAEYMIGRIEESKEMQILKKVREMIYKNTVTGNKITGTISKSVLLKNMNKTAKEVNEAINDLIQRDEITLIMDNEKTYYQAK